MIYRKNIKNQSELSQLGFGCMRFPTKKIGVGGVGAIDIAKSAEMVKSAIEAGVNYFDTAYIYPGSEAALGTILAANKLREKVNIATKMPLFLIKKSEDFNKFFEESLKRLQTNYVDYYLLHMLISFEYFEKLKSLGILDWIKKEKASGRIKNIGFSFHGSFVDFKKIIDAYDWEFCMIQYNYLDENYQAGTAGLKYANEKGLPVIIMEPLRGGKLAVNLPSEVMNEFQAVNKERHPADWGLRWVWNHPEVTCVLSGMSSKEQSSANIKTASEAQPNGMTEQELKAIEKAVKFLHEKIKVNCTGCSYCMPCPANVNIPETFSRYNDCEFAGKMKSQFSYVMSAGILGDKSGFASQCKKCGKCEKHCPQNIKIMQELVNAKSVLEPFWAKPIAKIGKIFTIGGVNGN